MQQTKLNKAMQDALYGPTPEQVQANKIKLKQALCDAMNLVDSGRLGAIIICEIIDPETDRVMAVPFGERRVVLESCRMVMRDAAQRAAKDLAKDMDVAQQEEAAEAATG